MIPKVYGLHRRGVRNRRNYKSRYHTYVALALICNILKNLSTPRSSEMLEEKGMFLRARYNADAQIDFQACSRISPVESSLLRRCSTSTFSPCKILRLSLSRALCARPIPLALVGRLTNSYSSSESSLVGSSSGS